MPTKNNKELEGSIWTDDDLEEFETLKGWLREQENRLLHIQVQIDNLEMFDAWSQLEQLATELSQRAEELQRRLP
jgi:hypothetical protein